MDAKITDDGGIDVHITHQDLLFLRDGVVPDEIRFFRLDRKTAVCIQVSRCPMNRIMDMLAGKRQILMDAKKPVNEEERSVS